MEKAAKTAAQIALQGSKVSIPHNISILENKNYYPIKIGWDNYSVSNKIPYLQLLNKKIFDSDNRVAKVMGRITDSITKVLFYNSLGQAYTDYRPMVSFIASVVMQDNGRTENAGLSRSYRMGFELLTDDLVIEVADEVIKRCSFLFNAVQPKGGEMPVVMGSGGSGILLHEAVGHAFEADFNRKNTSIFSDKMGQKIGRAHV